MDVFRFNTIVVGSGAAGFNAADRLYDFGQQDVAIVTEGINMGTSRNTGSDKQTYYKMTLAGNGADSIFELARTLFHGGCMHGDLALCEAALSARCFCKLADIGVPFPHNSYGEYVGYKTDHDPRQRATSAGPLTSRFMTEKLEVRVKAKNIRIFDGYKVIGIITNNDVCYGLLAICRDVARYVSMSHRFYPERIFALFSCTNVILATGGPAGLYSCSVYPTSQTGSNGIAFEAGAVGRNLTEWQYGIASTKFRWNLSGSYQQVIPRYVSTDQQGNDAREFLDTSFPDARRMLDAIFLKGYQWPFDSRKLVNYGSSLIDMLVHQEIFQKGRRVFLDFRYNPSALQPDFSNLGPESYTYLAQSGTLQSTPIERLAHLNQPAIDLYKNNGIDLASEMLEIAVCAQHNNGGLAVNCWWETNIKHLFAVGEAAGTHGVYRPGGSALNAGQVGSTRAAQFIAQRYANDVMYFDDFMQLATPTVAPKVELAQKFFNNKQGNSPQEIRAILSNRMSECAAHIRQAAGVCKVKEQAAEQLRTIAEKTVLTSPEDLITAFENVDLLTAQYVYAAAMENYITTGGGSRGSYIIPDENGTCDIFGSSAAYPDDKALSSTVTCSLKDSPDNEAVTGSLKFTPDDGKLSAKIQEVRYSPQGCVFSWEDVRPIPQKDDPFENVWREYRESGSADVPSA